MNLIFKDIITINNDYLDYLRSYDSKILINHNNRYERPNISILVDDNGQLWAIPMSHKEFLTKSGNNIGDTFWNIYIDCKDNPVAGHLKFNNMIPITKGVYELAKEKYSSDTNYINLLNKQIKSIEKHFDSEITPRFIKAFEYSERAKYFEYDDDNLSIGYKNLLKSFLNFELLLDKCKIWDKAHSIFKNIKNYEQLPTVKLNSFKTLESNLKEVKSIKYRNVFNFSIILKEGEKHINFLNSYVLYTNKIIDERINKKVNIEPLPTAQEYLLYLKKQEEQNKKEKDKSKNKDYERER